MSRVAGADSNEASRTKSWRLCCALHDCPSADVFLDEKRAPGFRNGQTALLGPRSGTQRPSLVATQCVGGRVLSACAKQRAVDAGLSHECERCDEGSDEVGSRGRNAPTRSVSVVSVMADRDPVSESRSRFRSHRLQLSGPPSNIRSRLCHHRSPSMFFLQGSRKNSQRRHFHCHRSLVTRSFVTKPRATPRTIHRRIYGDYQTPQSKPELLIRLLSCRCSLPSCPDHAARYLSQQETWVWLIIRINEELHPSHQARRASDSGYAHWKLSRTGNRSFDMPFEDCVDDRVVDELL